MARERLQKLKNEQVAVVPARISGHRTEGDHPAVVAPPAPMPVPPRSTPAVGSFSASRSAAPLTAAEEQALKPPDSFTECSQCPEMVVVPTGEFTMGSPAAEAGRAASEGPQTEVTLAKPLLSASMP